MGLSVTGCGWRARSRREGVRLLDSSVVREFGTTLSEDPSFLPDELKKVKTANAQCLAYSWNLHPNRASRRAFVRDHGAPFHLGYGNYKRICSRPFPLWIHQAWIIPEDILHHTLNVFIGRDKHPPALPRPPIDVVILSLQFEQDFLAGEQLPSVYEFVEFLPEGREDFGWVCSSPSVKNRAGIDAVVQATSPAFAVLPKMAVSIFDRCFSRTSRRSETSLAVMRSW